jgi:hypothetical protein
LFRTDVDLNDNKKSNWLYVETTDEIFGWIYLGESWFDPYAFGLWSIEEIITIEEKKWTVRKSAGGLCVWEVLNVRDKPGLNNTTVLFKLTPTISKRQVFVTILAITEEKDTIDGITDLWVKIEDEQKRIGWIFGGYATIERGGLKYPIPIHYIRWLLSFI